MSPGRTVWWAKDSAWWRREGIIELAEEFGADGPAVIDWLCCEAKAQNEGGVVKTGVKSVARGCFVELVTVGHVLSRSVQLGVLDDFSDQGRTFTCRISGWHEDQERGRAAARKAAQRIAASPAVEPNSQNGLGVTDRDGAGHVTVGHGEAPTGQDSSTTPHSPQGGKVVKFDRKPVPQERLTLAERLLAGFNDRAGTSYGAFTGDGKPSEGLRRIIGALTSRPDVDEAWANRAVAWQLARPYWDGPPQPGVVYGPGNWDKALEASKTSPDSGLSRRDRMLAMQGPTK